MKRQRLALCISLPDTGTAGAVPDVIKVIPAPDADGKVRGRDGRNWLFDRPEAVIAASPDRIVIDINHSIDLAAPRGEESPAAGKIARSDLSVVDGALFGTPTWNRRGKAAIEGEDYAYLSPVFDYDTSGRITRLVRVSLCNNPNFDLALNSAEEVDDDIDDHPETMNMKRLFAELGLPETATEDQALTALNALKSTHATALNAAATPDLNKFVPRAEYALVETRALNAERKLFEDGKAALNSAIDAEINAAVAAGKVTPASKEFYRATCQAEGGLEKFRAFVSTAPVVVEPGATVTGKPPETDRKALNAMEQQVADSLGLKHEEFAEAITHS